MRVVAIIVAAGYGRRMGRPKQFLKMGGRSILERTLAVFEKTSSIHEIILVVNVEDVKKAKKFKFSKLKKVVAGGKERQDSVYNGLQALPADAEIVVIHDGARPFITSEIIEAAVSAVKKSGAVVVGVPVKDTIKQIRNSTVPACLPTGKTGRQEFETRNKSQIQNSKSKTVPVKKTLDRENLWQAQTPQVFRKEIIIKAYQRYHKYPVTDDAMLVEKLGYPVKMIRGSSLNIKITTPEDLLLAEAIVKRRKV